MGPAIFCLHAGQDQVVLALLHKCLQDRRDPAPVRSREIRIAEQNPVAGAHRHLAAQDLFVIFPAYRDHADRAADSGDDLQGFLDRIIVRLVD
ncbi:MAG TPA: hypothetical protein VKQ11_04035 [Candidatus Sulfotelmatobacter sp.]|nr:hypothetical protein [Candidatus Sulfotelmatobacter sp.]